MCSKCSLLCLRRRFVVDNEYSRQFQRFSLAHAYVRRKEKSYKDVIDYDLDNEDIAWLNELQENRQNRSGPKYPDMNEETMEQWMDAFEKEALRKDPPAAMHDEEIHVGFTGVNMHRRGRRLSGDASQHTPCCVCWRVGGSAKNELIFCSRCHLAVHRECYGVERQREKHGAAQRNKPWFCDRCELDVELARQAASEQSLTASPAAVAEDPPAQVVPGWGVGTGKCW